MKKQHPAVALAIGLALLAAPITFAVDGAPDGFKVVKGWPQVPAGFEFGETAGVGVDSHNHVFIFHRGADMPVMCVEGDSGKIVHSFGEGLFGNAHGVHIDEYDNVWLADNGHHQIFKFSHDGVLLLTIGEKDVTGWDATHFNQPTDMVVAPNGDIFVTDGYGNNRVAKFDRHGKFISEWGKGGVGPGEFNLPHGITLDKHGRLYVADRANMRIQVFDLSGNFLHMWSGETLGISGRPWGLEFAPDGHLYVIDGGDMTESTPDVARIVKMDLKGNVEARWSAYGSKAGKLSWGHDVAVGEDGSVYTAEVRNNKRPQKFAPNR
jgi:peptidylamidoglycolate lyase